MQENTENNTKTIHRLIEFITSKGYSINKLSLELGVSNSYFNKMLKVGGSIGSDIIEKILRTHSDLNPEWLFLGIGNMTKDAHLKFDINKEDEMLKCTPFLSQKCTPCDEIKQNNDVCPSCKEKERIIESLENHITDLKELIQTKEQLTSMLFDEIDRLKNEFEVDSIKADLAG